MAKGLDVSEDCSRKVANLAQDGYEFVGRYLLNDTDNPKYLHAPEVATIHGHGLMLVTLWELRPTEPAYFTHEQGAADAQHARDHASQISQPPNSAIYFCVDYETNDDDVEKIVADYFRGVREGMTTPTPHPQYDVGVYGSGLTCRSMLEKGLAKYAWLACATEWHGTPGYDGWHIKQFISPGIHGLNSQGDISKASFGGW